MVLAIEIKTFRCIYSALLLNSPKGASYLQQDRKHTEQGEHPPLFWIHPYLRLWVRLIVRY